MLLEYPAYLSHMRAESRRFREVLASCDPAAAVPACPEWDAADLLWHLTTVQRFWAGVVRDRPAAPTEVHDPVRPGSYGELLDAFDEASAALLAAVGAADPAEPAWHWSPVQTVGTTYRRQAHEALIHRLDAEQATDAVTPLDPALAADGVAEVFEVMCGGEPPAWGRFEPSGHLVRVDLTDVGRSIWVRPGTFRGTDPEDGQRYDSGHLLTADDADADPDAVVSGPAAALDAWLWHRRDRSGITVDGDDAAYAAFHAAVDQPLR